MSSEAAEAMDSTSSAEGVAMVRVHDHEQSASASVAIADSSLDAANKGADDIDDDDAAAIAAAGCCGARKGHYEALIQSGWIIYWLEGAQLIFWFASGIYICAFTTEKFAVAHILSALHFTGSVGIAEVTEHLERAQAEHNYPVTHFERSWGFLFLLTLLADVLLLLDVAVYLPRDPITAFALEMVVGGWAMLTGIVIFVWAVAVALQTRHGTYSTCLWSLCLCTYALSTAERDAFVYIMHWWVFGWSQMDVWMFFVVGSCAATD